jgi:site-specific DNA-methyltransferase (adenine-specific)/modification methylase
LKTNYIYCGNCIEILETKIKNDSIHLIYADPPYNLSGKPLNLINNNTGGPYYKLNELWDNFNYNDYLIFTEKWISASKSVLKSNGSLYISCNHNNIAEIIFIAKKEGLKLNNIITWYKTNAMPNITKRTFTHSTEFVCWFVKGKNWTFNYDFVKKFNPNKTKEGLNKQMRDFLDFIELPIVQGQERLKGKNGRALHPAQKPEKLLELIILASSNINDIILDPFFGTGTSGLVAQKLNRKWIGIELNSDYIKSASKRLNLLEKYIK